MPEYTPVLRLTLPDFDQEPWDEAINGNLTILDAAYGSLGTIPPGGGGGGGGGSGPLTGISTLANIATLRSGTSDSLGTGPMYVQGYYVAGDNGGGWYTVGATAADNGGTVVNDASGRSWHLSLNGHPVSVLQFGAKADGTSDSTAACQTADTWSRANGSYPVSFPPGIRVTQLEINTGSNWTGSGRATAINGALGVTNPNIKQLGGHNNLAVIYGHNTAANVGADVTAVTNYIDGYTIRNMTIDGNWNNGAGNTGGGGLWIFGCKPILENVFIVNCATYGLYTAWTHQDPPGICPGFNTFSMEGYFNNVQIDTCGQHGWWCDGPHDTIVYGMRIVDAGRAADNTWDGVFVDEAGNGILMHGSHIWTRHSSSGSATVRLRYAVNCDGGPGFFHGCYFEGAYVPIRVTGYATVDGCIFGNPHGGNCVQLEGGGNQIRGDCTGPTVGGADNWGVMFTGPAGTVQDNTLDIECDGTTLGCVYFSPGVSGGGNYVRVRAILSVNETYGGTPHTNDDVQMNIANSQGQGVYSNNYRRVSRASASAIGIASGSTQGVATLSVSPGTWRIWGQAGYVTQAGTASLFSTNSEITVNGVGQPGDTGLQNVMLYNIAMGTGSGVVEPGGHSVMTFYDTTTLTLQCTPTFSGGAIGVFGNLHAQRM